MSTTPMPKFSRDLRLSAVAVVVMSLVINLLALSGAIYMLQVYDRVLTSQSVPTLVALSILVAGLHIAFGVLDVIRGQVFLRMGTRFDAMTMPAAYADVIGRQIAGKAPHEAVQPVRDVDAVRNFLASAGPVSIADLPWTPIFLVFVSLLSPWLGAATALGMVVLVGLAMLTDFATRRVEARISGPAHARALELDATLRSHEAVAAMGMMPEASERFLRRHAAVVEGQRQAGDVVAVLGGISKVVRLMLQSAVLGLGAYLAIQGDISFGAIVAASITASRALAPVEQAITGWRALSEARASLGRLAALRTNQPTDPRQVALPSPRRSLGLQQASLLAPDQRRLLLAQISLELQAGQGLAIVGASGSGKSSLVRLLAGVWSPSLGTLRLDGASLDQWDAAERGRFIGYMPQNVELHPGSIAENIARLDEAPDGTAIVAAAEAAGLHKLILEMPRGYETRLGPDGVQLSTGQRQQIGLARAIYGNPFLVVLDEPNANLDQDGEAALIHAIEAVRARGGIAVVAAHRRSLLASLDTLAVLEAGRLTAFGPKADVLRNIAGRIDDAPLDARVKPIQPAAGNKRTAS